MNPNPSRPTVLIVEDEADIRSGFKEILEGEGYRVLLARDGSQALDLLQSPDRPDVILLDLIMPEMNGLRFCQEVQHDPALAAIPIVLVSATVTDGAFASCNAAAHLKKPVDIERFLAVVAEFAPVKATSPNGGRRPHPETTPTVTP